MIKIFFNNKKNDILLKIFIYYLKKYIWELFCTNILFVQWK